MLGLALPAEAFQKAGTHITQGQFLEDVLGHDVDRYSHGPGLYAQKWHQVYYNLDVYSAAVLLHHLFHERENVFLDAGAIGHQRLVYLLPEQAKNNRGVVDAVLV